MLQGFSITDQQQQPVCTIPYLKVTINPFALLYQQKVIIHELLMRDSRVVCVRLQGEEGYNVQQLFMRLVAGREAGPDLYFRGFRIHKALLKNCAFRLDDQTKPATLTDGYHIQLESITAALSDVYMGGEHWGGLIKKFEGYDITKDVHIQHLVGRVTVTPNNYVLHHLYMATPYSHLLGDFAVMHEGLGALMTDPGHAHITADIADLQVDTQEVAAFCPCLQGYDTIYKFQGRLEGRLNALVIPHYQLAFGKSALQGSASLQNLSQLDDLRFAIAIDEGCLHDSDILPYVSASHVVWLQRVALCHLQLHCTGSLHQVVTQGVFVTNLGTVATDFTIARDVSHAAAVRYEGEIKATDFHVGTLLADPQLGAVTLQAMVNGKGVTLATACAHITTRIQQLTWRSYSYQNISVAGDIGGTYFSGKVAIDDPHWVSALDLQVTASEAKKSLALQGTIGSIACHQLGWVAHPLQLQGRVTMGLQGDSWADLVGKVLLQDVHIGLNNQLLINKEMAITTVIAGKDHTFCLSSDFVDAEVVGSATYGTWFNDMQVLCDHLRNQLRFGDTALCSSGPRQYTGTPYAFQYKVHCKQPDLLLHFLGGHVAITPHTTLEGSFQHSADAVQFSLHTSEIPCIQFSHHRFTQGQLSFFTNYHKASATLTASGQLTGQAHQWKHCLTAEQLRLDMNLLNDTLSLHSTIGHEKSLLQWVLHASAKVGQPSWQLHLLDTTLRLGEEVWRLDPQNAIQISPSSIACQNVTLTCQEQVIALAGQLSKQGSEFLHIIMQHFSLDKLSPIADTALAGRLQGTLHITTRADQPMLQGEVYVQEACIAGLHLGDVAVQTAWLDRERCMQVAGRLSKAEQEIIHLHGFYRPAHATQKLDLVATFSQTPLGCLEPLIDPVVSQLQGMLSGRVSVKGSLAKPLIKGKCGLDDVTLQFKHLKAIYHGKGTMYFQGHNMQVAALQLVDQNKGYADFAGSVAYHSLDNIQLDLKGEMHCIEVLNTGVEDNIHCYGRGVLSGDIHLKGPVQQLDIYANGITEGGTSLTIPVLKFNKIAEQEDFIRFVTLHPTTTVTSNPSPTTHAAEPSLDDLNLHLNLEITPVTHTQILFAGKNGDTLQAKGRGRLAIRSNVKDTFHISGSYELVEGDYHFTIYNVIKKKFQIVPGSTITWLDQIEDGMLRLQATYTQWASLLPLVGHVEKSKQLDNLKTKYPTQVDLSIAGSLGAPQIQFNIQLLQLPPEASLQEAVSVLQERIATDSDYLKTQVFSLIMLKKFAFSGQNVLFEDNSAVVQRSLGELFSQQLNSLAESINEDLEIKTDIDNDEEVQLPIKLSYNLWRNRLVISGESKIRPYDEQGMYIRDILDHWSLAYNLTRDKRLQLKLRGYPTGRNLTINREHPVIGGVSLLYQKSFNSWKMLFRKSQ